MRSTPEDQVVRANYSNARNRFVSPEGPEDPSGRPPRPLEDLGDTIFREIEARDARSGPDRYNPASHHTAGQIRGATRLAWRRRGPAALLGVSYKVEESAADVLPGHIPLGAR